MNDTTQTHNGGADYTSAYNVVAVSFDPDNNAYAALTALKELDSQGQVTLEAAAVVERGHDGRIEVKEEVGAVNGAGAAGGGLLGLLIGIVGGPLGVLVGGSYGLFVGSLFDLGRAEESESVLSRISGSARPGHTALLAQVTEQSPEVVDAAMTGLGGIVLLRRPVDEIEYEIAAAEEAQLKAELEAEKELMRGKREHSKEQAHAKVEQLKAKLPHRQGASAAS